MHSVSVVIPFYRAEKYFAAALDSVRAQTHPVSEVIVVVDGDTPAARAFFADLCDPLVKVFFLASNQGSAAARNLAVEKSTSNYIAFLDADDLWKPTKLEEQFHCFAQHADWVAAHTGVETFNDAGDTLAVFVDKPPRLEMHHLLRGNQVLTSSLVIKRATFLELGGFDTSLRTSQDFDLILRLARSGQAVGLVPTVLTRLRRANHGHISSNGKLLLKNHLRIAWRYRADLLRLGGIAGYLGFIAKFLREDGSRTPGLRGRLTYRSGVLLAGVLPRADR